MSAPRLPYGEGVFRRRIRIASLSAEPGGGGRVRADLEDDFHRFGVELRHDGARVVEAGGEARRHPWTTCPGALAPLAKLAGTPLTRDVLAVAGHTDPRLQCTHLFDVASLAVTHAAAGRRLRDYAIAVPDAVGGRTRPTLHRDGAPVLVWEVSRRVIESPAPFAGSRLTGRDLLRWRDTLDAEGFEAAWVLRRACAIALGRAFDLDAEPDPTRFLRMTAGACHTFQPTVAAGALRVRGSSREFTHAPDRLLVDG